MTYDKRCLFPNKNLRLRLSHTGLPLMADKLHRMLQHVGEKAGEAMNRLQIRSHQGKWDRRKQAGKQYSVQASRN
jgi:hypothetical protein